MKQKKEHLNLIKEWINDNEFFSKIKLGFSAKRDGFDSKIFHEKCDNQGKTLVIIKSKDNYICGGYTKVGWIEGKDYIYIADPDAFIFTIKNPKNYSPQKIPIKKENPDKSLYYVSNYGPTFGNGIDLGINTSNMNQGRSVYFGYWYVLPEGIKYGTEESNNFFAGHGGTWPIEEIECFLN
ncbi:hypothetical protein M0811_12393 [Anaeramoeba ignava]|uniref:TLDc domain-containing protein n=1 Tax=Anaeramoeba ignava TaxID=1746090 RepID=A0A9Q0L900_ANAIG|nr:hypothetical protein M0811_12393 [Anaeramoeba ignava]